MRRSSGWHNLSIDSHGNESRRSLRLRDHDYASRGAYFVTICTHNRAAVLGCIRNDRVDLSRLGSMVEAEWQTTSHLRDDVRMDAYVVMPNHLHGILWLRGDHEGEPIPGKGRRRRTLGSIVSAFKAAATRVARAEHGWQGPFWQRNYYERVVRDREELLRLREYIKLNPLRWALDEENPDRRQA